MQIKADDAPKTNLQIHKYKLIKIKSLTMPTYSMTLSLPGLEFTTLFIYLFF